MEAQRNPFYEQFADFTVDNNGSPEDTAAAILEALK
jgi:shikimate kinase